MLAPVLPACGESADSGASGGRDVVPQAGAGGRMAESGAELAAVEPGAVDDQGSQPDFGRRIVKTADLG